MSVLRASVTESRPAAPRAARSMKSPSPRGERPRGGHSRPKGGANPHHRGAPGRVSRKRSEGVKTYGSENLKSCPGLLPSRVARFSEIQVCRSPERCRPMRPEGFLSGGGGRDGFITAFDLNRDFWVGSPQNVCRFPESEAYCCSWRLFSRVLVRARVRAVDDNKACFRDVTSNDKLAVYGSTWNLRAIAGFTCVFRAIVAVQSLSLIHI